MLCCVARPFRAVEGTQAAIFERASKPDELTEMPNYTIRTATLEERPILEALIAESARGLSRQDYTDAQIETALGTAWGVDTELIQDETYFVVEDGGEIVACGGWSRRRTLFGGDGQAGRSSELLNPRHDAARIRAFFVRPTHARRGIGGMLLRHCEEEARRWGFQQVELVATLPGERLYFAFGYAANERIAHRLSGSLTIPFVSMGKKLGSKTQE